MSLSYRGPFLTLLHRFVIWPAEMLLLLVVLGFIHLLPIAVASALFGRLFALVGPLTPWHARARRQLIYAMPETGADAQKIILSKMWDNLGRTVAEYPKMQALLRQGRITFEGTQALAKTKGGFMVGAHLGNWEALAMIGPYLGLRTGLVYRPLNNPYISFLLKRRAVSANADIYEKGREAAMGMIATVRKGGYMMMLSDQQLREGENIPFFGHPAQTAIAHFKIAARTGVPVFYARTRRSNGCHLHVKLLPPIYIAPGASDDEIKQEAQKMNQLFEAWIEDAPEQWLWPHRRWGKHT